MKKIQGMYLFSVGLGLFVQVNASEGEIEQAQLAAFGNTKTELKNMRGKKGGEERDVSLPTLEEWEKAYERERQKQQMGQEE
jgi:hypothetical protein